MRRLFFIFATTIALSPVPAEAAWEKFYTQDNGAILYIEMSGIHQVSNSPKIWSRIDLKQVRGSELREVITLQRFDCDAQTAARLSMTTINLNGKVTKSNIPESLATEDYIIPGSVEWLVSVFACAEYNASKEN